MKVYVITQGCYSNYHICAVTLDAQEAERLKKIYSDSYDEADVEEWDTDDHKDMLCGRNPYVVHFYKNGSTTVRMDWACEGQFQPDVILSKYEDIVRLYAADSEAAVKIAAEKRAQAMAEREGLT